MKRTVAVGKVWRRAGKTVLIYVDGQGRVRREQ